MPSSALMSGAFSAATANPMTHVPNPSAHAASIRFSAASQQSADTTSFIGAADDDERAGVIKDIVCRIGENGRDAVSGGARRLQQITVVCRFAQNHALCSIRDALEELPILHHDEPPRFLVHRRWCVNGRVEQGANSYFVNDVRLVGTDCSSGVDDVGRMGDARPFSACVR